jgi:chemosensory pili system protein ChpA (sensor histidine kinase/response regulator)
VKDPTSNYTILLVDDSKTVLSVLRTYLMGAGFEFVAASDGRDALRLAMRTRPAVVISDVEMPHVDGLELCRVIRTAPGLTRTKVILISSKWTTERQEEAKRLKVDSCLQKPVDSSELARLVAKWFV